MPGFTYNSVRSALNFAAAGAVAYDYATDPEATLLEHAPLFVMGVVEGLSSYCGGQIASFMSLVVTLPLLGHTSRTLATGCSAMSHLTNQGLFALTSANVVSDMAVFFCSSDESSRKDTAPK